ncbi:MAG TPA: PE family protein, partial [Mycobacterium sp.]|nr:PE family protein [Mycobacterium sp.]
MSYLVAVPEVMTSAATDLAAVGSTVNAAHIAAAAPTVAVPPAAADQVSAGIAHLFSQHAQDYQALAGQAAAFQEQFVQHLTAGAVSYAGAEATNVASLLQPLTAIAVPVAAAATTAQSTLNDLVTNIQILITNIPNLALTLLLFPFFIAFWIALSP